MILFPPVYMGYTYSAIAQAEDFSLYLEDKNAQAGFCSEEGTLTKYTNWKKGDVLKST